MEQNSISNTLYKRSLLMIRLYWLILILTIIFWFLDRVMGIYINPLYYLVFIVYSIANIFIVKRGYVEISKIIGLSIFNILIYLIASSEPFNTIMHLQFVTAGAVALAVFGYEQWKGAIGFVLLSLILDLNMFYRAHNNSKGSGLGLYVTKETVEKLGGDITLKSTENKGSKFSIELPA